MKPEGIGVEKGMRFPNTEFHDFYDARSESSPETLLKVVTEFLTNHAANEIEAGSIEEIDAYLSYLENIREDILTRDQVLAVDEAEKALLTLKENQQKEIL